MIGIFVTGVIVVIDRASLHLILLMFENEVSVRTYKKNVLKTLAQPFKM